MNCLLRRLHQQPSEGSEWSYSTVVKDSQCYVLVKHSKEGWQQPFLLEARNAFGFSQQITIQPSAEKESMTQIRPYITLTPSVPRNNWKIPAIILQTWKHKDPTEEMKAAQDSFRSQQGYSFHCFDDQECAQFLVQHFGERYLKAFVDILPGAYRADFWRYCILYKFGGVYADAKTRLLRPLDEILRPQDELVLVKDLPGTCLLNGFIACKPGHPLIKIAIELCLERIEGRQYGQDPLDVTGPHLFGRAFCKWLGQESDTVTLNPGYTLNYQILGRSEDKKYIVSPEGERLMLKEYETYYQKDVNVTTHYPMLWQLRAIYSDSEIYKQAQARS